MSAGSVLRIADADQSALSEPSTLVEPSALVEDSVHPASMPTHEPRRLSVHGADALGGSGVGVIGLAEERASLSEPESGDIATSGWLIQAASDVRAAMGEVVGGATELTTTTSRVHERLLIDPFELHLLRTPCFKFWCLAASNVLLAVLVTFLTFAPTADALAERTFAQRAHPYLLLVWSVGGCGSEYRQIGSSYAQIKAEVLSLFRPDRPSWYRSDVFNILDFVTYHLIFATVVLPPESASTATALCSIASVCAYFRLLRLLTLSVSLGPLVLMLIKMMGDVLKLMAILTVVVLALSSGVYVLMARKGAVPTSFSSTLAATTLSTDSCEIFSLFAQGGNAGGPFFETIFVLLNAAVMMSDIVPCLISQAGSEHWALAWLWSFLFVLSTAILLLNVLIAMMAKTFDEVWESSELNYQSLFARQYVNQVMRPPEPPPLNVLRGAFVLLNTLLEVLHVLVPSRLTRLHGAIASLHRIIRASFEYDTLLRLKVAREGAAKRVRENNLDLTEEYVGTTFAGRNAFQAWKAALTVEEQADRIVEYCACRESQDFQEGRWRAQMMRRVVGKLEALDGHMRSHQHQLDELVIAQRHTQADRRGSTGEHASSSVNGDGRLSMTNRQERWSVVFKRSTSNRSRTTLDQATHDEDACEDGLLALSKDGKDETTLSA
jgi:hypothetical protein